MTSPAEQTRPRGAVILVMGVSGCGKSTLAKALAEDMDARYLDADDFHPPENVAKMSAGVPLTDADRAGWLARLNAELHAAIEGGTTLVLACSALKAAYREQLAQGLPGMAIVFLDGSRAVLEERLRSRSDHFMPVSLLDSQLATLEPPTGDAVIRVDFECPLDEAVEVVRERVRSISNRYSDDPAKFQPRMDASERES